MSCRLLRVNDRVRKEAKRRSATDRKRVRRRRFAHRHPNQDRRIVRLVLEGIARPRRAACPPHAYRIENERPTVRLTVCGTTQPSRYSVAPVSPSVSRAWATVSRSALSRYDGPAAPWVASVCQGLRQSAPAGLDERHLRPPSILARPSQAGAARLDRGCGPAVGATLNRYDPQDRGPRKHDCCRSGADRRAPGRLRTRLPRGAIHDGSKSAASAHVSSASALHD